jgi:hypothetical protein
MRAKPDWGTGLPIALIEERKLLRYRRVVVPANRVQWYKSLFGKESLFRPRRSFPDAQVLSDRGRRIVVRFDDLPSAQPQPAPVLASASVSAPSTDGAPSLAPGSAAVFPPQGRVARPGVVLKEERYPFPALLHGFLTVPRAERELHNLFALRSLGMSAVEPLACGHSGFWILYHRSFLITRELQGAVNLKAWMKARLKGRPTDLTPDEIERAMMSFAGELARLHRARCYVRTLYGKNVLARRAEDGRVELALCDVPRLWWLRGKALSFGLAARDLACLDKWARQIFGPRPRLAFLKAYLEKLGEGPSMRHWLRRILRQRERMRHRTFLGRTSHRVKKLMKRMGLGDYWPF